MAHEATSWVFSKETVGPSMLGFEEENVIDTRTYETKRMQELEKKIKVNKEEKGEPEKIIGRTTSRNLVREVYEEDW